MSTTSFTYFQAEDRLMVVMQPGAHKLWLTRRLTQSILRDVAALFASKVPGGGFPGAGSPDERIVLEHRMAMDEEDLAQQPAAGGAAVKFSETPPAQADDPHIILCTGLDAKLGSDYASLSFVCGEKVLTLRQSRPGFHRFLRTLTLCAGKAEWAVQDVPSWLTQSLLGTLLDALPPLDAAGLQDDGHNDS